MSAIRNTMSIGPFLFWGPAAVGSKDPTWLNIVLKEINHVENLRELEVFLQDQYFTTHFVFFWERSIQNWQKLKYAEN